jgi:hypothetical protein
MFEIEILSFSLDREPPQKVADCLSVVGRGRPLPPTQLRANSYRCTYQLPFRFNGKIAKLTYKFGPVKLTSEDHQIIQHALAKARD